ncbi:MAG: ImmA/IrrE family metallo-endopeptidase [Chloroflexi bacterium]|nr:ImmA/IrrE family metallo-endopeptidase [Chloroflexota bacterium]
MVINAKQTARRISKEYGDQLPVDVVAIARAHNIDVREVPLDESVSGVLIVKDGRAIIGVNVAHHPNRKRFSIAHELGHYFLHGRDAPSNVFVDAAPVFFRDEHSSDGTEYQEIQANAFAAELLMPETLVKAELRKKRVDAFDEAALHDLAEGFGVSAQALSIRLTKLGLITFE